MSIQLQSTCHPHQQGTAAVNLDLWEVTASEKQELKQLLDEHGDVYANNDSEVGTPTELSFVAISQRKSLLLLSFGELLSLYILGLISWSRKWNCRVSESLSILPILYLFCLYLKQMAHTISELLWMLQPSQRYFFCLLLCWAHNYYEAHVV